MATRQMMAIDQALAELQIPPPDPGRWASQLADVARQMRTVLGRHHDIVPCSIGFLPGGARALSIHERVLGIIRVSGLPDSKSADALHLLWLIVNGFSLEEAEVGGMERFGRDQGQAVRKYFASLPDDRFPNLVAAAGEFTNTSLDERFELLIRIFIGGLARVAVQS